MEDGRKINLENVILVKSNELNLKAAQYQITLKKIFVEHILAICKRENISINSQLDSPGVMIFFINKEDMGKSIPIFRKIMGIHSFSPAISSPRKMQKLRYKIFNFIQAQNQKSFNLNVKYNIIEGGVSKRAISKKQTTIQEELTRFLKTKNLSYSKNVQTVFIDIREKGTYIYNKKFNGMWGGMPIESKNAFLSFFQEDIDNFQIILANILLMRRGSIITPVFFKSGDIIKNIVKSPAIVEIYKYYSSKIPMLFLDFTNMKNKIDKDLGGMNKSIIEKYYFYGKMKIIEKLIIQSKKKEFATYNSRKLHFKGIILPYFKIFNHHIRDLILLSQQISSPVFSPLVGLNLNSALIQSLSKKYYDSPQDFSFNDNILQNWISKTQDNKRNILVKEKPIMQNTKVFDEEMILPIIEYFKDPKINQIITKIIENLNINYLG